MNYRGTPPEIPRETPILPRDTPNITEGNHNITEGQPQYYRGTLPILPRNTPDITEEHPQYYRGTPQYYRGTTPILPRDTPNIAVPCRAELSRAERRACGSDPPRRPYGAPLGSMPHLSPNAPARCTPWAHTEASLPPIIGLYAFAQFVRTDRLFLRIHTGLFLT